MAVRITYLAARQIADHALSAAPNEACGLLAGASDCISKAIPLENAAATPDTHFRLDPHQELMALKAVDAAGLDWVGIYHSHPNAPPIPSQEDIRAAVDHNLLQLIVSLDSAKPKLKLWRVEGLSVTPIVLALDTDRTAGIDDRLGRPMQAAMLFAAIACILLLLAVSLMLLPPAPEITPAP